MVKKWGILGLTLLISIYAIYLQIENKELEQRLEIISGSNLFLLSNSYDELEETINSDKQNAEIISDVNIILKTIRHHSSTIDTALGRDELKTIFYKFNEIFSHPAKIYTSVDNIKTKELIEITDLIQELNNSITSTYYKKDYPGDGKAELYIKDFGKMDAYIERLTNYTKEFTQKK
ncbi:hypothetical protein [Brevibacillus sp. Leaf182]|uniref:hypothetical protein n=1 Tax=Brevibacillus sp. Leaf182 TaxID=1736290 RepID=UPI0006F2F8C9|nr:hypothetical protein [Brevibacillus sp. Leaf182]RAT99232.1 hypothetical protein ASG16_005965 [Brevibacillus sp. Leaf182]